MTLVLEECRELTGLSKPEIDFLDMVPGAMNMVEPKISCSLHVGHQGPHYAFGQSGEAGREWWLTWDGAGLRELVLLAACQAIGNHEENACLLPDRHEGEHGFRLT